MPWLYWNMMLVAVVTFFVLILPMYLAGVIPYDLS